MFGMYARDIDDYVMEAANETYPSSTLTNQGGRMTCCSECSWWNTELERLEELDVQNSIESDIDESITLKHGGKL